VCDGVSQVDRYRVSTVRATDARETVGREIERLSPTNLLEAARRSAERSPQPIRVFMHIAQGVRLDAKVAAAQRVIAITVYAEDPLAVGLDGDPAHGFAKLTGAELRERCHCP
jgi:hypothetical protein